MTMNKELRLKFWREVAEFYAEHKGYKVRHITPYQIRLIGSNERIDLYPVGQKVNIVGTLEYPVIDDIEEFIDSIHI